MTTPKKGAVLRDRPQPVRAEPKATAPKPTETKTDSTMYYPVEMPSLGKFGYPATLNYRDIMVKDEKILATATRATYSLALNNILKSLLGNPEFYNDLTIYDRDFLLLWIWANNYSPVKTIEVTCAECESKENMDVDLTKLEIKEVDQSLSVPFVLKAEVGKEKTEVELKLRMITVGDQQATDAFIKENPDYDYDTILYSLTIDNGTVMPLTVKAKWVENNLTGRTMAMVRAFHEHFRYGVNDKLAHTCSVCSEVTHFRLPFRPEWLRPTVQADFEEMLRLNAPSGGESD